MPNLASIPQEDGRRLIIEISNTAPNYLFISHDTPFDIAGINIISYETLINKDGSLNNDEINNFKNRIVDFLNKYHKDIENFDSEIDIPYWHILKKDKEIKIKSTLLNGLTETKLELRELKEYLYSPLPASGEKHTRSVLYLNKSKYLYPFGGI